MIVLLLHVALSAMRAANPPPPVVPFIAPQPAMRCWAPGTIPPASGFGLCPDEYDVKGRSA